MSGMHDGPSKFAEQCHWCFSFLKRIEPRARKPSRLYWRGKYFCLASKHRDSCLQKFLERGFTLAKVPGEDD